MKKLLVSTTILLFGFTSLAHATSFATSTTGGGNWSATGTWLGGVVPGDGYFVAIQGPVAIDQDIGTAGNGIKTITVKGGSANLTVNTSSARTIIFGSTGTDPIGSGANGAPASDATMFGIIGLQGSINLIGSSSSPVTVKTGNGTSPTYISKLWALPFVAQNITVKWCDLYNLGTATTSYEGIHIDSQGDTGATVNDIENNRFNSPYEAVNAGGPLAITISNNVMTGVQGPYHISVSTPSVAGATSTISNNTSYAPTAPASIFFGSISGAAPAGNLVFTGNVAVSGTSTLLLTGIYRAGDGYATGTFTYSDNLIYQDPSIPATSTAFQGIETLSGFTSLTHATVTIASNIVEETGSMNAIQISYNPKVGSSSVSVSSNFMASNKNPVNGSQGYTVEFGGDADYHHNLMLWNDATGTRQISLLTLSSGISSTLRFYHNTVIGYNDNSVNQGLEFGEGGFPTYNNIVRDNIVSGAYQGIRDSNGSSASSYIADFNGVGVHHNDVFNTTIPYTTSTGSSGLNFDNGTTVHPSSIYGDVNADPQFVDSTRTSVTQFDSRVLGGAGTAAHLAAEIGKRSGWGGTYNQAVLGSDAVQTVHDWLFAGFAPTNSAISVAASDSSTIGAVPFQSGSVPLFTITTGSFQITKGAFSIN